MPHELQAPRSITHVREQKRNTTAEAIVDRLQQMGVTTVFGVPGGPIMGMFDALSRASNIETILCKHEQGAVFAAYGYAQRSGKLGVVVVTSGPGTTNALAGLGTAYVDRVPILVLAGQVATHRVGCGAAQDGSSLATDVVAMARPVTVACMAAGTAPQALQGLSVLARRAHAARRPALLQVPADALFAPAPEAPWLPLGARCAPFDVGAADDALCRIRSSQRVAMLLGAGVDDEATRAAIVLAEHLGAAVATTPRGKGGFPEDHPLSVGVFGFAGSPWASRCMEDPALDALVVLGSSLGELASDGWSTRLGPSQLIHVDSDPSVIGVNYAALPVVGDVAAVLGHWCNGMAAQGGRGVPDWVLAIQRSGPRTSPIGDAPTVIDRLSAPALFQELQACLPDRALVVSDIGNCMAYAIHHLVLSATQDFMINLGYACMGHAPAAAFGAHVAEPDRPVIALIGDAAFAMGGFEIHTAVEHPRQRSCMGGPVMIVLNDGGNGMVDAGARAQFGPDHGIDTGTFACALDIASIASGFGARTAVVRRPGELRVALERALLPGQPPTVIEVKLSRGHMPPMGARVQTLKHFAGAAND